MKGEYFMANIEKSKVAKIIQLHNEIRGLLVQGLEKAMILGELLIDAKKTLGHGHFTSWIEQNIPFDERTVRRYMGVYEFRERLKTDNVSDLTTAYKLVENIRAFHKTATTYNLSSSRKKKIFSQITNPTKDRKDIIDRITTEVTFQHQAERKAARLRDIPKERRPEMIDLEKSLTQITNKAKELRYIIIHFCGRFNSIKDIQLEDMQKLVVHWSIKDLSSSIKNLYASLGKIPEEDENMKKQIEAKVT